MKSSLPKVRFFTWDPKAKPELSSGVKIGPKIMHNGPMINNGSIHNGVMIVTGFIVL